MSKRIVVVGLVVLTALVLAVAAAVPTLRAMIASGVPELPVYDVEMGDFARRVYADGHLKAVDATLLGPPPEVTDSLTIAWLAEDGSRVERDEVVIRFDPTQMEEDLRRGKHDRETAQSKIVQQEALERATRSGLDRDAEMASLELDYAKTFQNKDERIFSRSEIIESDIDEELATRKRDHAQEAGSVHEELARTELDLLEIGQRQAEIKIEHAQKGLRALEVRAPHAGIFVLKDHWGRLPEVGQVVWGGNALAELPKLEAMEAEVFVLEADAGGLQEGLAARVVIEAHAEREFGATVSSVDSVPQRRNRRVPVQYFRVTLKLDETIPELMKPGQRVRSVLTLDELEQVIAIPRQAVFEDEGKKIVYRRDGSGFKPAEVKLGAAALGRVVVVEGLAPGDRIALRDPTRPLDAPGVTGDEAATGPVGAGS